MTTDWEYFETRPGSGQFIACIRTPDGELLQGMILADGTGEPYGPDNPLPTTFPDGVLPATGISLDGAALAAVGITATDVQAGIDGLAALLADGGGRAHLVDTVVTWAIDATTFDSFAGFSPEGSKVLVSISAPGDPIAPGVYVATSGAWVLDLDLFDGSHIGELVLTHTNLGSGFALTSAPALYVVVDPNTAIDLANPLAPVHRQGVDQRTPAGAVPLFGAAAAEVVVVTIDEDITSWLAPDTGPYNTTWPAVVTHIYVQGAGGLLAGGAETAGTATVTWAAGTPPTLSTTTGNADVIRFTRTSATSPTSWVAELVAADITPGT